MRTATIARLFIAVVALATLSCTSNRAGAANIQYQSTVLSHNPVAFWRLNETGGTTMVDISGNGHDGAYTNVVLGGAGVGPNSDTAGIFNGTTSLSSVPDDPGFDLLNFTVEAWVRLNGPTVGDIRVLNQQNGPDYWLLHLFQVAPGDYRLTTYLSLDGINNVQRGPNLNDGGYHHIAITRDTVNNLVSFYVDGALAGPTIATANNSTYMIASNVGLGAYLAGGQNFPGLIDEAVIYNTALTAADIEANFIAATTFVPEPSTLVLLSLGGLGFVRRARRRTRC